MTTLATTSPRTKDVRDLLRSDTILEQVRLALPQHMTPDRMVRVMCTAMLRNPKLLDCRQESLVEALMICSQAGIEPDGRNAHLIPYGDKVTVIFDYKGLAALAERNGVESIYADRVCDNDQFEAWVEEGAKKLKHRVDWKKSRGNAYAYYASCVRKGRLDYEVMTKDEVDAIRKRSKASGSGPWVTDYDEMAKKTVLRRMSKRWDLSPEVADAFTGDNDTPDFTVTAPVKSPVFDEPDSFALPSPPADPTPKPRAKRQMHPLTQDAIKQPYQPAAVEPPQATPTPEPTPEPQAAVDDFESTVDGESPELIALRHATEALTGDSPAVAEKKLVAWCVGRKLIEATIANPTIKDIPTSKLGKLTEVVKRGGAIKVELDKTVQPELMP